MALLSIDVIAGDDILASEYNNLRSDLIISGIYAYSPAVIRYLAVSTASAMPIDDSPAWSIGVSTVQSSSSTPLIVSFPVNLPDEAIVTSYKTFMYRLDSNSAIDTDLYRVDFVGGSSIMATADADSDGNHSVEDTSISNATIDNDNYSYAIKATITPDTLFSDVVVFGFIITYTITVPFP